jgi:16S rRNA (cytosine1402-N4)-methyltransferase
VEIRHVPVLLDAVLGNSALEAGGLAVDATTGEGGHSEALLTRFPGVRLICLDADTTIQAKARQRLQGFGTRVEFVNAWFDEWFEQRALEKAERPVFILMDLGISVFHYVESGRGFSFQVDESLDMRLSPSEEGSAADLVNDWSEKALADLIYGLGEETYSRRIARALVAARVQERIESTKQLADIIWEAVPPAVRHGRIHPATKTFQALRIAVNRELERLEKALGKAFEVLAPGGRLAVISFHSLEDRIVKTKFRELAKECVCPPQQPRCTCSRLALAKDRTRKPLVATEAESAANPPSRSAKLRVVEKLRDTREEKT